jgi:hypothetical protein
MNYISKNWDKDTDAVIEAVQAFHEMRKGDDVIGVDAEIAAYRWTRMVWIHWISLWMKVQTLRVTF